MEGFRCVLCGKWTLGWGDNKEFGNNPEPLAEPDKQCCDKCNEEKVIPARIAEIKKRGFQR